MNPPVIATPPSPSLLEHRQTNAARKRVQTRDRILQATVAACTADRHRPPLVEDVVDKARVSRGTFYNHFESIDAALAALGEDFTRRNMERDERVYGLFDEKWKRASVGFRLVYTRALHDPAWASVLVRTAAWVREGAFSDFVLRELTEGRASGQYRVPDERVALDLVRGMLTQGVASLHRGVPDPAAYIDGLVYLVLQGLGCTPQHCVDGVQMSRQFLASDVPEELSRLYTERAD
jgi:AcrR family transcriptional regulator